MKCPECGKEMDPVTIRNITIGEGQPKICVPIVGTTMEEILEEAKNIKHVPKDLVEWRVDWFQEVFDFEKVGEVLTELRKELEETPILFTFRTKKEGGEKAIDGVTYLALNTMAVETGNVDLIDIEIFSEEDIVEDMIEYAHQNKVKVIASNHDFEKTPEKEEIISRLQKMQDMEADILKIAVMPREAKDVLTLFAATEEMISNHAKRPVVTMSMSGLGLISRIAGEVFGSAITFGTAGKVSAPGQIPAEELSEMLSILHRSLEKTNPSL